MILSAQPGAVATDNCFLTPCVRHNVAVVEDKLFFGHRTRSSNKYAGIDVGIAPLTRENISCGHWAAGEIGHRPEHHYKPLKGMPFGGFPFSGKEPKPHFPRSLQVFPTVIGMARKWRNAGYAIGGSSTNIPRQSADGDRRRHGVALRTLLGNNKVSIYAINPPEAIRHVDSTELLRHRQKNPWMKSQVTIPHIIDIFMIFCIIY